MAPRLSTTEPLHPSDGVAIVIDPTEYNRRAWDRVAAAGDRFYRAVTPAEIGAAREGQWSIRLTPTRSVPREWFPPLEGLEVLCLAGGGGRQGPLLAAAGARVTVLDLSEEQLQRDREIARRESLSLQTVVADMRDLRQLTDGRFDLIVSPCATCFCPDVTPVWSECFRVLRPGGHLMIGVINPIHYLFDALEMEGGKFVVRHRIPYSDLNLPAPERESMTAPERPLEFGHTLEALLGGQLKAGFRIVDLLEDRWGGNDPLSKLIATFLCTLAWKPKTKQSDRE